VDDFRVEAADLGTGASQIGKQPAKTVRRLSYARRHLIEMDPEVLAAVQNEAQIFNPGPNKDEHTRNLNSVI